MTDAERFERCIRCGGVVVFGADTVYGLACDPLAPAAVARLYALKGRPPAKPSALMFFDRSRGLLALPELGERTRLALGRLLPGAVTVLVPNPAGSFPAASGDDPGTLGIRVPDLPGLRGVTVPVLQSSANLAGGPEARTLDAVPESIRAGADLVLDAGELPGTASTVIDLRAYEDSGGWTIVRPGLLSEEAVALALGHESHFDPATYLATIREEIPAYGRLQEELVAASGAGARRLLELGTGTGETARRLLARHPEATLVGLDGSHSMLAAARAALPKDRVTLISGALEGALPEGRFDLVASALCVHHLDGPGKRDLFQRVRGVVAPGGRFVLGDVVVPEDPADAVIELTPGYDRPSRLSDQLRWLGEAGFAWASVTWSERDLAVLAADA
ncbi:MAG: Sua5/YciO/YrdC/YwlC family protein [Solirubrobacteraceae bacterium]